METIHELLEYMDRRGEVSINVQDGFGTTVAVLVRVQPAQTSTAQRMAAIIRTPRKGRTPKGTKLSRRQRQAAKAARR